MAKITQIMADMEKVENGQWVPYAAGVKLLIANINNSRYREARQIILQPHRRALRGGNLSSDDILDLLKPAVAKHILLGWKNLEDDKGKPIAYSATKALEFFENPALADLYNFVLEVAGEVEFFRMESAKNLPTASDGS